MMVASFELSILDLRPPGSHCSTFDHHSPLLSSSLLLLRLKSTSIV